MSGTLLRLIEFSLRSTVLVSGALSFALTLAPKLEVAGARSSSDPWLDERQRRARSDNRRRRVIAIAAGERKGQLLVFPR